MFSIDFGNLSCSVCFCSIPFRGSFAVGVGFDWACLNIEFVNARYSGFCVNVSFKDRINVTHEKEDTIKVLSLSSAYLATLVTFGRVLVYQTINFRKNILRMAVPRRSL